MTDVYTAAVDALYDARNRGRVMDEAARDVVDSVRPIIEAEVRERIAAEIEAERDSVAAETENDRAYDIGMTDAARIARGTP